MIKFGPAGRDEGFYGSGFRKAGDIAVYVSSFGLNAFEYQCVRGVKVNAAEMSLLKSGAEEKGIALSVHAPYYISMSGTDTEKRLKSVDYVMQTARAADLMGADRIIIHTGGLSGQTRAEALSLAKDTMQRCLEAMDAEGFLGKILLCPETMGKINQLGTLDEVLELASLERNAIIPCVDFGHLNARTRGGMTSYADFESVASAVKSGGFNRMHSHFSMIEYTEGGEKRHLTFADGAAYGPDYRPMIDVFSKSGIDLRVISESAGTQTADSAEMKKYYESLTE